MSLMRIKVNLISQCRCSIPCLITWIMDHKIRGWSAFARILNVRTDDIVSVECRYENDSNLCV
ncbi:hypothetical protein AHAS_Ahas18G0212500 [Arachis hypogaea]